MSTSTDNSLKRAHTMYIKRQPVLPNRTEASNHAMARKRRGYNLGKPRATAYVFSQPSFQV